MKNHLLLVCCALLCTAASMAQSITALSPWDSLLYKGDQFYSLANDTNESSGRNAYKRWKNFWSTRVNEYPDATNDFYSGYYKALATALDTVINQQQIGCHPAGRYQNYYHGDWELAGPLNMPGQNQGFVEALWVNPTTNVNNPEILAGVQNGGLWKKEANSNSWRCLTDNSPNLLGTFSISSIAVNRANYNHIYIACNVSNPHNRGYGFGVYYTTDGGLTWQQDAGFAALAPTWPGHTPITTVLKFNPHNGSELFALCGQKVLLKVGGQWSDLGLPNISLQAVDGLLTDLEFHPTDPTKLFVSAGSFGWGNPSYRGELWAYDRSITSWSEFTLDVNTPGGAFNTITGGTPGEPYIRSYAIFMHPTNNHLYMMVGREDNFGRQSMLVRYHTTTASWSLCNDYTGLPYNEFPRPRWFNTYQFSPTNPNIFYGGAVKHYTYIANNAAGSSYSRVRTSNALQHDDFRCTYIMRSLPSTNGSRDVVVFGNDGGISIKKDFKDPITHGQNMLEVVPHENFATTQWNGFDVSEQDKLIAGGVMHNGMFTFDKDLAVPWVHEHWGDGYNAEFDKANRRVVYGAFNEPGLNTKSFDAGPWVLMPNPAALDNFFLNNRPIEVVERTNAYMIGHSEVWTDPTTYTSSFGDGNGTFPQPFWNNQYGKLRKFKLDEDASHGFFAFGGKNTRQRFVQKTGASYEDITPLAVFDPTDLKGGNEITALVMDPKDSLVCWIGLGGIGAYGPIPGCSPYNRVLKYDGNILGPVSTRWQCISDGLPVMGVNALAYVNGTDDVIYAGTDVGVFVYVKGLNRWEPFNMRKEAHWNGVNNDSNYCVPPFLVMDLDINYCEQKIYAATHGRAVWKSDLGITHTRYAEIIPANTTVVWDASKYVEGDVLIERGATLRITGTVNNAVNHDYSTVIHMPKNAKIDVEQGARLEINNATLTQSCGEQWDGIYLHGDITQPQVPSFLGLDPAHGQLVINGGRIERAHDAINNFGGNAQGWGSNTGGVIEATNCLFYNNWRAVQFHKYGTQTGGSIDRSFFTLCDFVIDDDAIDDFIVQFTMWGVEGVRLKACNFRNLQGDHLNHGHALYTLDASYDLAGDGFDYEHGTIEGFHEAVKSTGYSLSPMSNTYPIQIHGNLFDKNEIGIYLSEMFFPAINSNAFKIGANQTAFPVGQPYYSIGSKLVDVSLFEYCSNTHTNDYGLDYVYTAGTEVYNSGAWQQAIHKNSYHNLLVGNDAAYTCGNVKRGSGLYYTCNYNSDNTGWDFIFQANPIIGHHQRLWGSNPSSGNTFTYNANLSTQHWQHIGGNSKIDYWHSMLVTQEPTVPSVWLWNPVPTNMNAPDCEREFCSDVHKKIASTGGYGQSELQARLDEYAVLETNYNSAKATYDLLIDDGDTPQTEIDIENSNSSDMMQIRAEMLATSPYVSQKVLMSLAEKDILTHAIFLEILLSNPEATQSESFLEYLQFEAPSPLPQYMIGLIRASWSGSNARTGLELSMAEFLTKMTKLRNEIYLVYATDEVLRDETQAFIWLQKLPTLKGQYQFIEHWLDEGNVTQAETILLNLPSQWEMNEQEFKDYTSYVQLFNFKKSLKENNMDISQLSETKKNELKAIADLSDFSTGREMARNALCFFYHICYPAIQNPYSQSSNKTIRDVKGNNEESNLRVYPNPAKDHVTFEFINPDIRCNDCSILVTDLQGRSVYEGKLDALSHLHIWDTREVPAGAYIYQVKTNLSVQSGKLIITK